MKFDHIIDLLMAFLYSKYVLLLYKSFISQNHYFHFNFLYLFKKSIKFIQQKYNVWQLYVIIYLCKINLFSGFCYVLFIIFDNLCILYLNIYLIKSLYNSSRNRLPKISFGKFIVCQTLFVKHGEPKFT